LAIYGLAVAFIFIWVPWCGILEARNGKTRDFLGYSLVWSMPKPSAASIKYETARHAFNSSPHPPPGYSIVPPPNDLGFVPEVKEPEEPPGYISSFVYKQATVDYGRILLEFGALTGLLIMAWMIAPSPAHTGDRQ